LENAVWVGIGMAGVGMVEIAGDPESGSGHNDAGQLFPCRSCFLAILDFSFNFVRP
jgi:hypothetical protein